MVNDQICPAVILTRSQPITITTLNGLNNDCVCFMDKTQTAKWPIFPGCVIYYCCFVCFAFPYVLSLPLTPSDSLAAPAMSSMCRRCTSWMWAHCPFLRVHDLHMSGRSSVRLHVGWLRVPCVFCLGKLWMCSHIVWCNWWVYMLQNSSAPPPQC